MEGQKKFAWLRSCRLGTLLGLLLAGGLLLYGLCLFLSYRAADIFNIVVEHRQLFPGTVTVGRLTATPLGRVEFEKLVWVSPEGVLLADIPRGEFQVKPLDIITQHVGSRSVTHLKVEGAYLHLIFDENMQLTGFRPPDKAPEEKKKREPGLGIVGLKSERPFKCLVEFKGGTIEAEAPGNKKTSPRPDGENQHQGQNASEHHGRPVLRHCGSRGLLPYGESGFCPGGACLRFVHEAQGVQF